MLKPRRSAAPVLTGLAALALIALLMLGSDPRRSGHDAGGLIAAARPHAAPARTVHAAPPPTCLPSAPRLPPPPPGMRPPPPPFTACLPDRPRKA